MRNLLWVGCITMFLTACGGGDEGGGEGDACGPGMPCQSGLTCDPQRNICVKTGSGADARPPDAPPTGETPDGPPGEPPDTTITQQPPAFTTTATFAFTSTKSPSTFKCKVDNGAFAD